MGFGSIVERPCAVDGLLGVQPVVTASLSADHRATTAIAGRSSRTPQPTGGPMNEAHVRELVKTVLDGVAPVPTSVASRRTRTCAARSAWIRSIS